MRPLKLAVISDIHVGKGARAKDLCPAGTEGLDTKIDDRYQEKFIDFLREKSVRADYLIVPGDATHSAQPEEFRIASDFIAAAATALKVVKKNIVFVPGNHDVDWKVLELPDTTGVRRAQRYESLRFKKFGFKSIIERGTGNLLEEPHFTVWNNPDLLIVGYNSAHHDEPRKLHHGLVAGAHLRELRKFLASVPLLDTQVRLFLVHHHPLQYTDPTPEAPDVSIMVNAEELHALLREAKFDILVHGHKHLPRFTTHSFEGAPEVAILCSGSFSVQIDTRWVGTVNNQFHLITIDGRDPEESLIKGQVESWSYYYSRGWVASNIEYDGIPHIEPFGSYLRPGKLRELLLPILTAGFAGKDFIEWSTIISGVPRLQHLRPEVVRRAIDDLSVELGYKRVHDEPAKIILLKNR